MSLKKLAINASIWSILQNVFMQSVRFLSNIVLTRLLLPEYFGVMQLVLVFNFGLQLLSDLGVRVSIIQNKNGDEKNFIRTAWSIQIIRGLVLWILGCILAAPFANFYGYSELKWLIPVACFDIVIRGLYSTNFFVLQKHLQMKYVANIRMLGQVAGTLSAIIIALLTHSVWALVISSLINSCVQLVLSHRLPGPKMKFTIDKAICQEIIRFGVWILISGVSTFFSKQLDRLFFGKILSADLLGMYGIAALIAQSVVNLFTNYSSTVLMPLYRKIVDQSHKELLRNIRKIRNLLHIAMLPPVFILVIWGVPICNWLYPKNFSEVGPILQILSLGIAFRIVSQTMRPIFFAYGDSFAITFIPFAKIIILGSLMYLGYEYYGFEGSLYAIALSDLFMYPIIAWLASRHKVWSPVLDLGYLALCVLVGVISGVINF